MFISTHHQEPVELFSHFWLDAAEQNLWFVLLCCCRFLLGLKQDITKQILTVRTAVLKAAGFNFIFGQVPYLFTGTRVF